MMKRLMQGDKVIGDYPDDWEPPESCDLDIGLKNGSMFYTQSPDLFQEVQQPSLSEQIIANPIELEKLKKALGLGS